MFLLNQFEIMNLGSMDYSSIRDQINTLNLSFTYHLFAYNLQTKFTLFIADNFIIDIFNSRNGVISLQLMNNDANLQKYK